MIVCLGGGAARSIARGAVPAGREPGAGRAAERAVVAPLGRFARLCAPTDRNGAARFGGPAARAGCRAAWRMRAAQLGARSWRHGTAHPVRAGPKEAGTRRCVATASKRSGRGGALKARGKTHALLALTPRALRVAGRLCARRGPWKRVRLILPFCGQAGAEHGRRSAPRDSSRGKRLALFGESSPPRTHCAASPAPFV